MVAVKPKVDPEFSSLIPALTAEEFSRLETNILEDGCREPLAVWRGLILDGHNRFDICCRHDIEFSTVEVNLPDRDAAKVWIIHNQFGRRNLTSYQRCELVLQLESLIAARSRQGRRTDLCQNSDKGCPPLDTKKELAKLAGVSHDTLAKAKTLRDEAPDAVKEQLRRGDVSVHAAYQEHRPSKKDSSTNGHVKESTPAYPSLFADNPADSAEQAELESHEPDPPDEPGDDSEPEDEPEDEPEPDPPTADQAIAILNSGRGGDQPFDGRAFWATLKSKHLVHVHQSIRENGGIEKTTRGFSHRDFVELHNFMDWFLKQWGPWHEFIRSHACQQKS